MVVGEVDGGRANELRDSRSASTARGAGASVSVPLPDAVSETSIRILGGDLVAREVVLRAGLDSLDGPAPSELLRQRAPHSLISQSHSLEITASDITLYEVPIPGLLGSVHEIGERLESQSPCRLLLKILERLLRVLCRQGNGRGIKVATYEKCLCEASALTPIDCEQR